MTLVEVLFGYGYYNFYDVSRGIIRYRYYNSYDVSRDKGFSRCSQWLIEKLQLVLKTKCVHESSIISLYMSSYMSLEHLT